MATLRCLFLAAAFVVASHARIAQVGSVPDLLDATLDDLNQALSKGCFRSTDLVNAYLARIGQVNEQSVHAVTEVNPDALDIAKSLDDERERGHVRGPLHGIPILLKNNIATMDKMNNTAGSTLLLGAKAPRDSDVARRLREAGAILLGKTNLSQWASFRSPSCPNGWSAHGGQVRGAYHPEQDPGGSSSGSAVATDLGLAFAALGTDTMGSISGPASSNGIVGIRPSLGLTSSDLVIPVSKRLDVVGSMARSVRDAAQLLSVISGAGDLATACGMQALTNAAIGIPWLPQPMMDATWSMYRGIEAANSERLAVNAALGHLQAGGARIFNLDMQQPAMQVFNRTMDLLDVFGADFAAELPTYLDQLTTNPSEVHSLADLVRKTQQSPAEDWPHRDTFDWEQALLVGSRESPRVLEAWARVQEWMQNVVFDNVDAIVLPTTLSFLLAPGLPQVTVPLGHYPDTVPAKRVSQLVEEGPGLPFGLTFVGRPNSDRQLIGMACAFEQRSPVRAAARPQRFVEPRAKLESRAC